VAKDDRSDDEASTPSDDGDDDDGATAAGQTDPHLVDALRKPHQTEAHSRKKASK
jgi:hypothetical protein